jgi:hypothetical protein
VTRKIPDLSGWHPSEQQKAARKLADTIRPAALHAALVKTLPGFSEALAALTKKKADPNEGRAVLIYAEIHDAICDLLANLLARDTPRPTIAVVRHNLDELESALAAFSDAWKRTDIRTRHHIYLTLGEDESSPLPNPLAVLPDAWDRGLDRMTKFHETVQWIGAGIARAKAELPPQDGRRGDYDAFVARLADVYTTCTGRPFTSSRKEGNATDFVDAIAASLPARYVPPEGTIESTVRRVVSDRKRG